jgi:hypothetical protein
LAKKAYVRNSDNTAWVELASATTDLTDYATKTYADNAASTAVTNLIDAAPTSLNTLNELAAALGDDANYASTITTSLGNKQDVVSGVSSAEIGYLDGVTSGIQSQLNAKAPLASAALTGSPTVNSGRIGGVVGGIGTTTSGSTLTVTHGLGVAPISVTATIRSNAYNSTPRYIAVGNFGGANTTTFTVFANDAAGGAVAAAFSWIAVS